MRLSNLVTVSQRPLEVQPGLVARADDVAELLADARTAVSLTVNMRDARDDQQREQPDEYRDVAGAHQRSPRPRASTVTWSASFAPALAAAAACSALWGSPACALLFSEQLVDRQVDHVAAGLAVDQHLVRAPEHALDRSMYMPAPRHLRRLRVGALELREARRLALGDRHHLRLVGLGVLLHARGGALRHRQDVVGVGLRLEDEAFLVGLGLVGVALRGNHRIRHLHVLEVDGGDRDAGVVVVERALDQLLGAAGDLRARAADLHVIERAASHDLADGALAHLAQRGLRIAHLNSFFTGSENWYCTAKCRSTRFTSAVSTRELKSLAVHATRRSPW